MTLSPIELAEWLDGLAQRNAALVTESEQLVTVSLMAAADVLAVMRLSQQLGWQHAVFDSEHNPVQPEDITEDFAPFRLDLSKPLAAPGVLFILTGAGLHQWLTRGHGAGTWRVAGLRTPLCTRGRLLTDWASVAPCPASQALVSPRRLVKETRLERRVPADIRPWLLSPDAATQPSDPSHRIWSFHAFDALASSLANEIDGHDHGLIFHGPPRLKLTRIGLETLSGPAPGLQGLQEAATWVYENPPESSLRHGLLAVAIAQSGQDEDLACRYLGQHMESALDNARIAYQLSLSQVSRDTLKLLSDLRKAVGEETARATEATRQTALAITTALTLGTGFAAAQLNLPIQPWLVGLVMTIICICYALVAGPAAAHIFQQRRLRSDWQTRLYRFLTEADYQQMVAQPCARAERVFMVVAAVGTLAVLGMSLGWSAASLQGPASTPWSPALPKMQVPAPPVRGK